MNGESFMQIKLKIVQDVAGAQGPLRPIVDATSGQVTCMPYIQKNPVCGVFRSASMRIKGKHVLLVDELSPSMTLFGTVFDNRDTFETYDQNNKIMAIPHSLGDPPIPPNTTTAVGVTVTVIILQMALYLSQLMK